MKQLKKRNKSFWQSLSFHPDLLESNRTEIAHIEFTSRCNLRCVFCAASQPGYIENDLDGATIDACIEALKTRDITILTASGHGETTTYKDWHIYCRKMSDAGFPLHIISNFAKDLTPEEVAAFCDFQSIEISCDSSDPLLFKKLRRGADLKTLCLNIHKIRSYAIKYKKQPPLFSFSCVVSDQNIFQLPDLAYFARSLGVEHFNFCNLNKYKDIENTLNPRHVTTISPELFPKAKQALDDTFAFLKMSGMRYHYQHGFVEAMAERVKKQKITATNPPSPTPNPNPAISLPTSPQPTQSTQPPQPTQPAVTTTPAPIKKIEPVISLNNNTPLPPPRTRLAPQTKTRDCLDPWNFIMIQSNRDVVPCCWYHPIVTLGKNQLLDEAFNNTQVKQLRHDLLTGDLSIKCINCPSRGWTTVKKLKRKVRNYLNPGLGKFLFFKKTKIKPDILNEFQLVYLQGWYPTETDNNCPDPDWKTWRWIVEKADCKTTNPRKNGLLIIQGMVEKHIIPAQKIWIKLNDIILDEFTPHSDKFYRELIIPAEMMKNNPEILLTIETDHVFIPSQVNPDSQDHRPLGLRVYRLFFGERIHQA